MYANAITITAQTNYAIERIATSKVNGHVALASRLKRNWQSLCAWFVAKPEPSRFHSFCDSHSTLRQLALAMSGQTCLVAVDPRPVQVVPGGVDLRRTRLLCRAES